MRGKISLSIALLCFLIEIAIAEQCHSAICRNLTSLKLTSGSQCLLMPIERGDDCINLKFESLSHITPKEDTARFKLSAYVKDFGEYGGNVTAFNLSITNINFHSLITRYQSLADENLSSCEKIKLLGNASNPILKELYLSCPFSDESYEARPYRLEYSVTGGNYIYSKKFVFKVPRHKSIGDNCDIKTYVPFIYVDVSDTSILTVYIQLLPQRLNVNEYKIWLMNNDTNTAISVNVFPTESTEHLQYNFTVYDGVYYFIVAAMHPHCSEYGCVNSTSPFISIKEVSHRVLIMIISVIWIPPVILYAVYQLYKIYRKKGPSKRAKKRPNCLLVYSPTHTTHVNVMAELTKYLKCCNINAVLDIFEIGETARKDAEQWYNTAFHNANVVLIATSPLPNKTAVPVMYHNIDNYIFQLLKENHLQGNKRYYIVQLPYCKQNNVPEEARHCKQFFMPRDLSKLVKTIHGVEYIRFFGVSEKDLLNSIKLAELEILEESGSQKNTDETDNLLPSIVQRAMNDSTNIRISDMPEDSTTSSLAVAKKNDSNLLNGDCDGEGEKFAFKHSTSDCETSATTP